MRFGCIRSDGMPGARSYEEVKPEGADYDKVGPIHGYVKAAQLVPEKPQKPTLGRKQGSVKSKAKKSRRAVRQRELSERTAREKSEDSTRSGPHNAVRGAGNNQSKVNLLMMVLTVIFTLYLVSAASAVIILLHHSRVVDWFPVLITITGEGYLIELPEELELGT